MLQSPIDAAINFRTDDLVLTLVSYLLHHGAAIPLAAVSLAAFYANTELLSVALGTGADPNFCQHRNGPSSIILALRDNARIMSDPKIRAELATMLLNAGIEVIIDDAICAIEFGDLDLVKEILKRLLLPDVYHRLGVDLNLAELASFKENSSIILEILKHGSTCYSSITLCAVTLRAVAGVIEPDIIVF